MIVLFCSDYSLTGSDSQYDVADSHATPAKLADTLNLPEPSGYTSSDDLNLVAGEYKADANKVVEKYSVLFAHSQVSLLER